MKIYLACLVAFKQFNGDKDSKISGSEIAFSSLVFILVNFTVIIFVKILV